MRRLFDLLSKAHEKVKLLDEYEDLTDQVTFLNGWSDSSYGSFRALKVPGGLIVTGVLKAGNTAKSTRIAQLPDIPEIDSRAHFTYGIAQNLAKRTMNAFSIRNGYITIDNNLPFDGAEGNSFAITLIAPISNFKIGGGYYLEYSFIKGWCLYEIIHYPKKNNTNNVKQKEFILLPKRNGGSDKECDICSMHLNRTAKGNLFSSCRGRFEHWKLICTCSRFVAHSKSHKARFQTRQRYNAKWWWLQLLGFDRSDGRRSINRLEQLWVSSSGMELPWEHCGSKTCEITKGWCYHG